MAKAQRVTLDQIAKEAIAMLQKHKAETMYDKLEVAFHKSYKHGKTSKYVSIECWKSAPGGNYSSSLVFFVSSEDPVKALLDLEHEIYSKSGREKIELDEVFPF